MGTRQPDRRLPLAQQRQDRRGQVQAATAAATSLTCFIFRFLRRPHVVCANILSILTEHSEAILVAAEEIYTDQTEPVYHPFSLDLTIRQIGLHHHHFAVQRHLGHGHKDLQERFLRYMKADQRSALQSLALALEFDETLFQFLVSRHVIKGIQIQDFYDLVSPDNSHILAIGQSYRFHSKMQEALLAHLHDQENGTKKAQTVIEILIAYYAEQLAQAVQDHATSAMQDAFARASNILLAHAQSGLLDIAVFQSTFFALDESLPDGHFTSIRKSAWIRASAILIEQFSEDNEYALSARANVAHWTGKIGEVHAALVIYQALLPDQQRVLGPDHPHTLTTRHNIAAWTGEKGDAATALALFQALLPDRERVLGPDHSDTLATRSHIAAWTGETGGKVTALALFQALLPDRERVLGPDHPDTLATRSHIAAWTGKNGDAATALALYQALISAHQRVLGHDHPDTLITRSHIAFWTGEKDDAATALALFQALLLDRQRVLGPDHPHTLTTRHNIAAWTGMSGDSGTALALFQTLLFDRQRVLGPDHIDTLTTRSDIAYWTGVSGDAGMALALFQALLPDRERVLGPDHPDTCSTKNWITHFESQQ